VRSWICFEIDLLRTDAVSMGRDAQTRRMQRDSARLYSVDETGCDEIALLLDHI